MRIIVADADRGLASAPRQDDVNGQDRHGDDPHRACSRFTRRDSVDYPPRGQHDDICNVVSLAILVAHTAAGTPIAVEPSSEKHLHLARADTKRVVTPSRYCGYPTASQTDFTRDENGNVWTSDLTRRRNGSFIAIAIKAQDNLMRREQANSTGSPTALHARRER